MKSAASKNLTPAASAVVAVMLFICIFLLAACNKSDNKSDASDLYQLYMNSVETDDVVGKTVVRVSLKEGKNGEKLRGLTAERTVEKRSDGMWWFQTDTAYTLDSASIYNFLENKLAADGRLGAESDLIIVFDYVTIYKSVDSNGERTKAGDNYLHSLTLGRNASVDTLTLTKKSANTGNWYTVLIAGGLLLAAAIAAFLLGVKKKSWQTKTEE